jgi:predicted DNA-binding protein (MmcQ/YjbR family)
MNLDRLRHLCLSFPHATENLQWGEELCFKVSGKIFAMVSLAGVPQRLTFKCDPESFAELTEREGIVPAPYVGRYKWVMLEELDATPAAELEDLLRESYGMVASKAKAPRGKHIEPRTRRGRKIA